MFVRNILRPGDYLVPVPLGIPCTLEYNDNGMIANVYLYYNDDRVMIDKASKETVISCPGVVHKIPILGGTSWVQGVLYTKSTYYVSDKLFFEGADELLTILSKDPSSFHFYACNVSSIAAQFYGAGPIRQWLKLNRFDILSGQLVPATINQKTFNSMWAGGKFEYDYPLMMYYFIFRTKEVTIVNTLLFQDCVTQVNTRYTESGSILADVKCSRGTYTFDYYEVVNHNVNKGNIIYLSSHDTKHILRCKNVSSKPQQKRTDSLTCAYCGKTFKVLPGTICDDVNCLSRKFAESNRLLATFSIPEITFSEYTKLVKSKDIIIVPDILNIDKHLEYQLNASISSVVRAIVPEYAVRKDDVITSFVNNCNNNKDTVKYYINNVDRAIYDFNLDPSDEFITWLSYPENVADVLAVLDNLRYKSTVNDVLFDGAPIFRDKKIYVTGKFRHGDMTYISSLLASYSAEVTTKFDVDCHVVLVGDILEDVSGKAIKQAQNLRIPVISETDFFNRYDIDSDIHENLL